MTIHPLDDEIPNVPEIVPNRGFMIAADGTRVGSVYQTPRACIGCGTEFTPLKTPSRRISETCSDLCRRRYARKEIGVKSSIDRAEKHETRTVTPLDQGTSYPPAKTTKRPNSSRVFVPQQRSAMGRFVSKHAPDTLTARRDSILLRPEGFPLARAVETRRIAWRLSQKDVANAIGVPTSTLRNWLYATNGIPPHRLGALARFFDCTPEDLWNDR